jgi:hypothetical protein
VEIFSAQGLPPVSLTPMAICHRRHWHQWRIWSLLLTQMTPLAGKPFQAIATMAYTRWHTRPSQKDLGCMGAPSFLHVIFFLYLGWTAGKCTAISLILPGLYYWAVYCMNSSCSAVLCLGDPVETPESDPAKKLKYRTLPLPCIIFPHRFANTSWNIGYAISLKKTDDWMMRALWITVFAYIFFRLKRNAKHSHFPPSRTKTNKFLLYKLVKKNFSVRSEMWNAHICPPLDSNENEYERRTILRIATLYCGSVYVYPYFRNVRESSPV